MAKTYVPVMLAIATAFAIHAAETGLTHPVLPQSEWQLNLQEIPESGGKYNAEADRLIALPLDELKKQVKAAAARIRSVDERAGDYEDAANVLAYRALQEKNEDYARRALWILYLIAEQTRDIFETRPTFFNPGTTISPSVYAYDKLHDSPAWKHLPADARKTVEEWYVRSSWSLLRSLARTGKLVNMMPHAIQRGTGTALVLNSPELMRGWIGFCDRFLSPGQFLSDGIYEDFSPSYHYQVMNHLRPAMFNFEQFRDPPGYRDLVYGLRLDGTYSFRDRWPLYELAARADDSLRFPDNRLIPLGDTHCPPSADEAPGTGPTRNLEFNHAGHFSLNHGSGAAQQQLHLTFAPILHGPPYGGGHAHMDNLGLILYGAGSDWLADAGYAAYADGFGSTDKYFHHTVRSHNTAFAWDRSAEPYRNRDQKPSRSRLLAYEDGNGSAGNLRLLEASSPGDAADKVALRRRLLLQIAVDDAACYTLDLFRLKGGEVHESYLRQTEDEPCTRTTDAPLKAETGTLKEILGPKRGSDYNSYLHFFREVKSADGSRPLNYEWRGNDSGNRLNVFLNPVPGSVSYFATIPNLRLYKFKNPRREDGGRAIPFGKLRGDHLTRTRPVSRDELTVFGALYEVIRKGEPAAVTSVDWFQDGGAIAVTVTGKMGTDLIYSSDDTAVRTVGTMHFSGPLAVVRRTSSGEVQWVYTRGGAWVKGDGFLAAGKPADRLGVVGFPPGRQPAAEQLPGRELLVNAPPEKLAGLDGQWIYPELSDGSGYGVKVVRIEPHGTVSRLILANSPVFRADGKSTRVYMLGKEYTFPGTPEIDIAWPSFVSKDHLKDGTPPVNTRLEFSKVAKNSPAYASVEFLKKQGWRVNRGADSDEAFSVRSRINPFARPIHPSAPLLQLWNNGKQGTPEAVYPFGPLPSGSIRTSLGTAGVQNQGAVLRLNAGNSPLLELRLNNNTDGEIRLGDKVIRFQSASRFLKPQNFDLRWKDASPDKQGLLTVKSGSTVLCADEPFAQPGIPDRFSLTVGYDGAANRGLLAGDTVISNK